MGRGVSGIASKLESLRPRYNLFFIGDRKETMFNQPRSLLVIYLLLSEPAAAQLTTQQWQDVGTAVADIAAAREQAACMRGQNMTPGKRRHAMLRAQKTMQSYFTAARAGSAFDATPFFSRETEEQISTGSDGQKQEITDIVDPMAAAAVAALPEPSAFERAHDYQTAEGLWLLRSSVGGDVLGGYAASFRRANGRWLLTDLRMVAGDAKPPRPYCHSPGDIDEHHANDESLVQMQTNRVVTRPVAAPPQP